MSTVSSPTAPPAAPARHHGVAPGEIAIGVIIGRVSEFFDFFVFGLASVLVFPKLFFPFAAPLQATLYSFALFSLAFVARPIGSLLFKYIHVWYGRGTKLTVALFLLGTSTAGIAFLPGYGELGETAIVLLALLRIGQGLGQAGSWDGLPSLLALNAPRAKRGWYAMIPQLGAPLGFALAAGLFTLLTMSLGEIDFLDWGWRYPFYVAFAINVVALFSRLRLVMTPEFSELLSTRQLQPSPLRELMREQGSNVLIGSLAPLASYALFHLVTIFPLSWATLFARQELSGILIVQLIGAGLAVLSMMASGKIADRIGRRPTLAIGGILIAIFSGNVPLMLNGNVLGGYVFILLGFVLLGFSHAQAAGAVNSAFEARYRYTGAILVSDMGWLFGAGFAPLVALLLAAELGMGYVGLYLSSGAIGTLAALGINRSLEMRDDESGPNAPD
ncbi:Sugar phosphate permease [Solimonas aquatica]|uniref:Sugar phosphate permease n=1 Tax=Solimonas aquatica TaxID=489703 RepID=A0A1H9IWB8_9GAMM|nr:MFS transporter [Solimonas aquatica]SEQ79091.1 Sugar phosphate permease [Solimonas aquatica]